MPRLKRRPNGSGTAVKRGRTYQARVVIGWHIADDGHKVPDWATKDGFPGRKEALAYCDELKRRREPPPAATFTEVYEAWELSYTDRISHSTLNCYRAARNHFAMLHPLQFNAITIDHLQRCVDKCGKGKRTREDMKALSGLLYKYAIPRLLAPLNLAQYIHTGENDKGTRIAFSDTQIATIKANVDKVPYADYILALIYTGFRPAELFDLKHDAYDSAKKALVGGAKTDAGKNRHVTVSPRVASILEARAAFDAEYLFPRADGTRMTAAWFRTECFYPALEQMQLNGLGLSPYSCRHSFANLLKNVTGSDTDKAALMGHANAAMTKYYQSADLVSLRAITDRI